MKARILCLLAVVALVFSSCKKEPDVYPYITMSKTEYSFSCENPEPQVISFRCNVAWTVEIPSDCSWVSVDKTSGGSKGTDGYYKLNVSVQPNTGKSRSCTLTIRAAERTKKVNIVQSTLHLCSDPTIPDDMIFSTTLGRNSTNVAQGFDYDPDEDVIYITQKYGTWRNHIGWQKRETGSSTSVAASYMTLGCFSHGNNICIEKQSGGKKYVWAPNYSDRQDDGSYDKPKIVSRFLLQSSTSVMYNTSTTENYYFGQNVTWPAFDFENDMMAICNYNYFYVYRLSELMALPSKDITLDYSITYGGSSPVDTKITEYTGKPTVNAKDCRDVKPLYTVKFDYGTRGLHWQTYCIHDGWIYAILQADKKSAPDIIFDTYVECYKMDGTKNLYKIQQAYMQNRERLLQFDWTDTEYFYCEPEGIKVMGQTMLLLYTIRGAEGKHDIRRPVIFKLANPVAQN